MTAKECGHQEYEQRALHRRLFATLLAVIALILFIILVIWLILRPSKPHFVLQDATVYSFNVSSPAPNFLTSNFQITLLSRNPNARIGILYDKLDLYATYRSQQITLPTRLPTSYQGHKDITVWSPFLYGTSIPVAPYLAVGLGEDQMAGTVLVNIRVYGRVRWKVGTFISGRYHLNVNCPAYITFGSKNTGFAVKYQLVQSCNVDV